MKQKDSKIQLAVAFFALVAGLLTVYQYINTGIDHVVINEVCCYNDNIIYDTIGNYYDYIELYNPTSGEKDISGLYLSDDKDDLKKYILPENTVVDSKSYLLLWAGIWSTETLVEDASYYMGFSLKAGETIYLSDEEGNIIDKIMLPIDMDRDTSYSRISVSNNVWRVTEGTPGYVNNTEKYKREVYLQAEVEFSAQSGFYDEPFFLELSTNEKYDIYYTLDGSKPDAESIKYDGPIYIEDVSGNENVYSSIDNISLLPIIYIPPYDVDKATVIRAIAVDPAGDSSKDVCATYFVGYQEKYGYENIATVSIITDPENLFGYEDGIYVTGKIWDINKENTVRTTAHWEYGAKANFFCEGKDWRRDASLQYFDEDGNLTYTQQIELACHGKSSLQYAQKSFNIYAVPEEDGNQYVCAGMFGKYEDTMMLRSGGGDYYRSKLRDVLGQELVKERELATSDFKPCQVFIDGEYWGLYMLQERVCESMIANTYSVETENIVILKNDEVAAGEETDLELWTEVMTFATTQDMTLDENYEQMEQMIDIQSCIEHYCFQIYVANSDSFRNNYARWRVREVKDGEYEDGKWRWIIYDVDDSMGDSEGLNSAQADSFVEGNYYYNIFQDELFAALIQNREFKQQFVTTFMDMANYDFDADRVLPRLEELSEELCDATVLSHRRFIQDDYSEEDYQGQIDVIKRFFSQRYDYITAYLKNDFLLEGELVPITVKNAVGGTVRINTISLDESEEFAGKYYSDYVLKLSAEAKEGYEFLGWDIDGEIYEEENLLLELYDEYMIIPLWEKTE